MGLSNVNPYDSEWQVPSARKEQEGETGDGYLVNSYQHFSQLAHLLLSLILL